MALHTALLVIVLIVSIFLLHPDWSITKSLKDIFEEIHQSWLRRSQVKVTA